MFFSIGCSNERRHLERRTQIQMKIAIAGAGLQKFSAGGTGCRVGKHVDSRIALLAPLRKSTVHAFFLCDLVDGLKPLSRIFFEQENVTRVKDIPSIAVKRRYFFRLIRNIK